MNNLNKKEKDLLKSYNNNEWKTVKNFKSEKRKFEEIAQYTIEKNKFAKSKFRKRIIKNCN